MPNAPATATLDSAYAPTHEVVILGAGGSDRIAWMEAPTPTPGEREVLVRVEAAGVAFGDILLRRGLAGGGFPVTPGYDLVGIVEALGLSADRFVVGDRVAGFPGKGAQRELVCLPQDQLAPVPPGIPATRAVAVVLNYLTALQLLQRAARLEPGQSVFVYGLSGGLGSAMREVSAQLGIRLFGTASRSKMDEASRGATAFDRGVPNWMGDALRVEPNGFDAVIDPIGGRNLTTSFNLVSRHGILFMLGAAASVQGSGSPRLKLAASLVRFLWLKLRSGPRRVRLFLVKGPTQDADAFLADMALIYRWLTSGSIDPAIHTTLPLREARAAQEMLERGDVKGKIVLVASAP